jgi:hypothetical protein
VMRSPIKHGLRSTVVAMYSTKRSISSFDTASLIWSSLTDQTLVRVKVRFESYRKILFYPVEDLASVFNRLEKESDRLPLGTPEAP